MYICLSHKKWTVRIQGSFTSLLTQKYFYFIVIMYLLIEQQDFFHSKKTFVHLSKRKEEKNMYEYLS